MNSPLGNVQLAATSLYVTDLDKAVAWYREKLGWEPMNLGVDQYPYAAYLAGSMVLVLSPREAAVEAAEPGHESTTINLIVDRDVVTVRDELMQRGVSCGDLVPSPTYLFFLIRDLDGNRFYVNQPMTPEAQHGLEETQAKVQPA